MATPEIHTETEFERDMVNVLSDKEILFYSALKAIRSDIATLRDELQIGTTKDSPRAFGLGSPE